MIADTAAPPAPVVAERGQQRGDHLRDPGQPDHDLGDDAQRAFRAGERADQVVAGRAPVPSPSQVSSPAGVTICSPVTWCTVKPCLRQCAPPEFSATLPPTEQITWLDGSGRVEVAVRPGRGAHRQVGDAGLHDGPLADRVDRDDPAHPRGDDQHAVGARQRAAGQAGARAAGHERHPGPGALGDHRRDLLGRLRQHDQARAPPGARSARRIHRCAARPDRSPPRRARRSRSSGAPAPRPSSRLPSGARPTRHAVRCRSPPPACSLTPRLPSRRPGVHAAPRPCRPVRRCYGISS